jgi:von Willebrand factor type A C-terminal domain/von Willebrand factor type A domain
VSPHPDFRVDVYQNEYLPEGGNEVNAIVTVTATGGTDTSAAQAAEVIIVDTSGSMEHPITKLEAAKQATAAAIDTLRDGVLFAVVSGSDRAEMVYPPSEQLVAASPTTRAEAKAAVAQLGTIGGTAIGRWLALADQLLSAAPDAIRHAILLTDGKNEHEAPGELERTLAACAGRFTVDCRGVGTDWVVSELRKIATTMLGSVDIVADPAGLEDDFRSMTAAAMSKAVADIALRLWTPQGAVIRFVKQVEPTVVDLTGKRMPSGPLSGDYPTGSWGKESRDYHVCVEVRPAEVGEEMLAARVMLVQPAPGGNTRPLAQGLIRAIWTDDSGLSTRINTAVAHYTGQAELAQAIQEGLEARKAGDFDTATAKLGRAVALAARTGHEDTAKLLAKVVDVVDPATGRVRLKPIVSQADEMTLDTRSTKTVRVARR